jgi:hypothetical protein
MNFDDTPLALLRETNEVDIETMSSDGRVHRTTIWVVADERDAYVRSVRRDD